MPDPPMPAHALDNLVPEGLQDLMKTIAGAPADVKQRVMNSRDMNEAFKNAGAWAGIGGSDGLTVRDINNLAKMHGNELGTKAFSKTGDPLTSVNAQSFENTRTGIKNTARELFGDDSFKAADAEMSNLIRSRDLAEKMTVEVNRLRQRIQERGLLEKVGRGAFEVIDMLTGKFASGFLRSALVPRGGGLKVLNALDLEKNLAKTLSKIKSVPLDGSADDITRALEKIINDQSSPSIQDLTPGNTLKTKSNAITPQSVKNSPNISTTVSSENAPVNLQKKRLVTDDTYQAAKQRFDTNMKRLNSGVPVDQLKDFGIIAAYHIETGVRTVAELAEKLASEGYKFTKQQVQDIYDIGKSYYDDQLRSRGVKPFDISPSVLKKLNSQDVDLLEGAAHGLRSKEGLDAGYFQELNPLLEKLDINQDLSANALAREIQALLMGKKKFTGTMRTANSKN